MSVPFRPNADTLDAPEFTSVDPVPPSGQTPQWDRIHDIELNLTVELGATRLSLTDLAHIEPGDTIELDQLVVDPVTLLLNDVVVAYGEIAIQGDQYAVIIKEIDRAWVHSPNDLAKEGNAEYDSPLNE